MNAPIEPLTTPPPDVDVSVVAPSPERQRQVAEALRAVLPAHCVMWRPEDTRPYECDGLSMWRALPMVVVLPETEQQVIAVMRTCRLR